MQLNYQDLKKYMTIVYELEEEICFQNELMAKLQQKISSLGISRNINPPKKPPTKKITIPELLVLTMNGLREFLVEQQNLRRRIETCLNMLYLMNLLRWYQLRR